MMSALNSENVVDTEYIGIVSSIVNNLEFSQVLSYFPEEKRNLKIKKIYDGARHGWKIQKFKEKVFK
jgi:hypothetical protein